MTYVMICKNMDHINLLLRNRIYLLPSWDDGGGEGEWGVASDFSPDDFRFEIGMRGKTCIKDNYGDLIW